MPARPRIALLLLAVACAHAPPPDEAPKAPRPPPAQTPEPPAEQFVVLRATSTLYVRSDLGSDSLDLSNSQVRQTDTLAFRLLGHRRNWLTLETLGVLNIEDHCGDDLAALRGIRIRLHAPAEAAVPVVARPIHLAWPDGTALDLEPGVPLFPWNDPEHFLALVDDLALPFRPPTGAVGVAYPAFAHAKPATAGLRVFSEESVRNGKLQYGDGSIRWRTDDFRPRILLCEERAVDFLSALATVDARCARVTVRVSMGDIENFPDTLVGELRNRSGAATGLSPRVGARLFWRDGAEAGTVVGAFHFDAEEEPAGDRRCFRKALSPPGRDEAPTSPANAIHLCLASADLSSS